MSRYNYPHMAKYKDYYEILGVSRSATEKEIKSAFRKLARKYHPDTNRGNKDAEEKFKEINEAYEVLSNPDKKRRYDTLGSGFSSGSDFTPPPGFDFPFDNLGKGFTQAHEAPFSDFFEMLFGETFKNKTTTHFDDLFTQAYPRQQTAKKRGDDQSIKLELTIEEAYRGTTRKMDINIPGLPPKRLEVKIPPNVREGSKIRMSGEGSPGKNGGQTGDLYLVVALKKHPFFVIENDDINSEILITPSNAVLGTEIEVPTLDGPVRMVIPPGTQNDKMLRLRGKGMPHQKREGRGDHFVKVKINIPTVISEEEKKLYQELLKVEKRKN